MKKILLPLLLTSLVVLSLALSWKRTELTILTDVPTDTPTAAPIETPTDTPAATPTPQNECTPSYPGGLGVWLLDAVDGSCWYLHTMDEFDTSPSGCYACHDGISASDY